jgi:hypothetical protein
VIRVPTTATRSSSDRASRLATSGVTIAWNTGFQSSVERTAAIG